MGFDCIASPSFLFHRGSFFMSLTVETLYGLFFLIDGCSADSCDFGVLVKAGEFWVLLLCHLGCYPLC